MKKLRFLALAFVLAVTSLASVQTPAEAHSYPSCTGLEGTSCTGSTTKCWMQPNPLDIRTCFCSSGVWRCPIYGGPT